MPKTNENGFGIVEILIVVVVVILIGIVTYLGIQAWVHSAKPAQNAKQTATVSPSSPQKGTDPVANTHPGRNSIWAGYVANGETFTNVEGRVKVPTVTCTTKNQDEAFAAWAGFDGSTSDTVEQTGITATCDDASGYTKNKPINGVTYYAWSLIFNGGNSKVFDFNVSPGDVIFYQVSYVNGLYRMTVKNETTGQAQTDEQTCRQQGNDSQRKPGCTRAEAEWIVERPGYMKMANFDTVTLYDNKATTQNGRTGYIEEFKNEMLDMYNSADVNLAYSTDLLGKGVFKVHWAATGSTGL